MPLPMQGDKLLPCRQHVVGCSLRPGPPNRRRGDDLVNAGRSFRKASAAEFGDHGGAIRRAAVGENVDQLALELGGLDVAELHRRELLQVLVQEPRMIDHRLQDERLAQRNGGTLPAMNGTRGQLRACRDIGLARKRSRSEWRTTSSRQRIATNPSAPICYSPFAIRRAGKALSLRRPLVARKQMPQLVGELATIIFANGVVR